MLKFFENLDDTSLVMRANYKAIFVTIILLMLGASNIYAGERIKFTFEEGEFGVPRLQENMHPRDLNNESLKAPGDYEVYRLVPTAWLNPLKNFTCWYFKCPIMERTENIRIEGAVKRKDAAKPLVVIVHVYYYDWAAKEAAGEERYKVIHVEGVDFEEHEIEERAHKFRLPSGLPPTKILLYIQNGTPATLDIGAHY